MIDINENIDTKIIFLKERLKIVSIKNTLLKILPIMSYWKLIIKNIFDNKINIINDKKFWSKENDKIKLLIIYLLKPITCKIPNTFILFNKVDEVIIMKVKLDINIINKPNKEYKYFSTIIELNKFVYSSFQWLIFISLFTFLIKDKIHLVAHSHPFGDAYPSVRDVTSARACGIPFLIYSCLFL